VQAFIGFANFYRRFIEGYSEQILPLTQLTKKNELWLWSTQCQMAFESLKTAFMSAPILVHWDPDNLMIVETDTSDHALAAILSTRVNGNIHLIAFHSRTFSATELNYDVYDKELLAIFEAFRKWRHYLEGIPTPVDVFMDHKNLVYFCESKALSRRQARWSEFLSQFNLTIKFCPGRLGAKPDTLTRYWDVYDKERTTNSRPLFTQSQLDIDPSSNITTALTLQAASILDTRSLTTDIQTAVLADPTLARRLEPGENTNEPHWSVGDDGILLPNERTFVPESNNLHLRVLRARHNHQLASHMGQEKTYQLVCRDYSWLGMQEFIKDYVKTCSVCMRNKPKRHKPYRLLKQLPIPPQLWESISMDFIEQLPESQGFTDILVVVDRLTKQAIFTPTQRSIDATGLAEDFVRNVFSKHRVLTYVTSDRGSEFVSKFFKALALTLDMKLHFTSGYHPEANGQTERTNETLEQYLRIYYNYQQSDWVQLLPLAEFTYNNTPLSTTSISPFFANKGYHPHLDIQPGLVLLSEGAQNYSANLEKTHIHLKQSIADA